MPRRGPTLFVSYSGHSGGAERFLVEIASALPGPVVVACPPGGLADECRTRHVPVVRLRERPLELHGARRAAFGHLAGHAREIRRLARELEPGLVFTWGMRSALAAAALPRRGRPPWIARHHDFLPQGTTAGAVRRALLRADAVVVNSQAVADNLDLGAPVDVIPPGVDLARFSLGTPRGGPPLALWLGAIVDWKRPDLAVEIAARAPEITLRIAGTPLDEAGSRLLDELRSRAAENVEFIGRVDAAQALAEAHVLLHTADREPFGIAVAEALASGVPVVAPNAGGPAEIVDETCGCLFDPGDADGAAAAIREIIADQETLARGARARAEERLDLERARREFAGLVDRHREPQPGPVAAPLAFVTVTHNSAGHVDALLTSIGRHLPDAEVMVVDSGSDDDSASVAQRHGARVIELDNVGYGAAANRGVAEVSAPVTVVLNPDIELLDGSISAMAAELSQEPGRRIMVPKVLLPDGRRQDVAQREPGTAAALALAFVPPSLLPRRLAAKAEPWRAAGPRRADWPVGACFAARTETLRALGPFDPGIFMYAEDLDLGMRARDAGVETWFWPSAAVMHERAHTAGRSFGGEPFELLAQQRAAVVAKRRGAGRARADRTIQTLTLANRIALKTLIRRDTTRERRQLAALRSHEGRR